PAYRALLADELADPTVRVLGFSDDVGAVLAASDVLVLPTIEEGSALVTYEAQGTGCVPLVSTAAGAMLDHDVQGLVHEPRDVATLTT
ncbi:glycosyltransferase, partial [Salmonella enterica subsp. enterica serovar Typhimurium]|uniref:glycosyltransferase family 4 protein n=1 Tax=Salmonella enterica TaxID=28901 RepID=UPI0015C7144C